MPNLEPDGSPPRESQRVTFSCRAAVKVLGAVAVWPYVSAHAAAALASIQATQASPVLAFLTPAQYTTLDALTETIIPADDRSPGARAQPGGKTNLWGRVALRMSDVAEGVLRGGHV